MKTNKKPPASLPRKYAETGYLHPPRTHMQKPRVQKLDRAMCARVSYAFGLLKMTYEAIARDAGIPSKAQLIEIANGVMEPSKRVILYLSRKGFSAHWILTGKEPVYWVDMKMSRKEARTLSDNLSTELKGTKKALDEFSKRLDILQNTIRALRGR